MTPTKLASFFVSCTTAIIAMTVVIASGSSSTTALALDEPHCIGCQTSTLPFVGPEETYVRVWTGGPVGDPSSYALAAKITMTAIPITQRSWCTGSTDPRCKAPCDAMYAVNLEVDLFTSLVDLSDVSIEMSASGSDPLGSGSGPSSLGDAASADPGLSGLAYIENECGRQASRYITFNLDWSTVNWPSPLPPDYVPPHYFESTQGGAGSSPTPGTPIIGERPCCVQVSLECARCVPLSQIQ